MRSIFFLYFRRSLPWTAVALAAAAALMPLLTRFSAFSDPDIVRALWFTILLPAACLIIGSTAGAETAATEAAEAETQLPVSGFARLSGAALAALAAAALLAAAIVPLYLLFGGGSVFPKGPGFVSAAYALALLLGCVYAFVFGRLSGSIFAGAAAGAVLAALTAAGALTSIGVDAMVNFDNRLAYYKLAALLFAAACALLSLKYISALGDRKAGHGLATTGLAALLLAAGVLAGGTLLASSKRNAERLLIPAFTGDIVSLAGHVLNPPTVPHAYSLLLNPVTEGVFLLGPDSSMRPLLDGRGKSYAEFLKNPLNYTVHSYVTDENGGAWALIKRDGMKLFYAEPGGKLEPAAELGFKGANFPAIFRVGAKAYLAMRGKPDTLYYIAELIPGAGTLNWTLLGSDAAQAERAMAALQKSSGAAAWLSADRTRLLLRSGGRETEVCRLPYKGPLSPSIFSPVRSAGRDLFFVPLVRDGKKALYYCEKGKAARPAWDAPGYLPPFFRNSDGSVYTNVEAEEKKGLLFYMIDAEGNFLPPSRQELLLPGLKPNSAYLAKASGKELFFVLDHKQLVKSSPGRAPESLAAWDSPLMTWRTVRDGIVYMNNSGTFLVSWKGEKRRLY